MFHAEILQQNQDAPCSCEQSKMRGFSQVYTPAMLEAGYILPRMLGAILHSDGYYECPSCAKVLFAEKH